MSKRKLHIGDKIWHYTVGRSSVSIWSPEETSHRINVDIPIITHWTWDNIERARWKRYWTGVKPSEIKEFIQTHLNEKDCFDNPISPNAPMVLRIEGPHNLKTQTTWGEICSKWKISNKGRSQRSLLNFGHHTVGRISIRFF